MPKKVAQNIAGQKFGRLTAISRAPNDKKIQATWNCKCDCGKERIVVGYKLLSGNIKSCGCWWIENIKNQKRKPPGYSGMMQLIWQYKRSAKRKNHSYNLSDDQFKKLTSGNCYYCGASPSRVRSNGGRAHAAYTYNGIDRKDNNLGYTLENSVSCCFTCNDWKSNMPYDDFLLHIEKIHSNMGI